MIRVRRVAVGGVVGFILVACNLDSTTPLGESNLDESNVHTAGDSGSLADARASMSDARIGPDSDPGSATDADIDTDVDANTNGDAASNAGPPTVCTPTLPCPGNQHSTYADHFCGAGVAGTCVANVSCNGAPAATVCGCNGEIYSSRCAATQHDADPAIPATCTNPVGTYRCGDIFCPSADACNVKDGTFSCRFLNGCILGCLCTDILLGCVGGSCTISEGHLVIACP
jgi:hypothetical protein